MRNSGANGFWIVNDSTQVHNKVHKLNDTTTASHFDNFDFSTLYTNIPHDLLIDCLNNLVKEAYRFSNKYKDIFGKFGVSLKQHIKDGIPLPLATMGRLNRLVTVR